MQEWEATQMSRLNFLEEGWAMIKSILEKFFDTDEVVDQHRQWIQQVIADVSSFVTSAGEAGL